MSPGPGPAYHDVKFKELQTNSDIVSESVDQCDVVQLPRVKYRDSDVPWTNAVLNYQDGDFEIQEGTLRSKRELWDPGRNLEIKYQSMILFYRKEWGFVLCTKLVRTEDPGRERVLKRRQSSTSRTAIHFIFSQSLVREDWNVLLYVQVYILCMFYS